MNMARENKTIHDSQEMFRIRICFRTDLDPDPGSRIDADQCRCGSKFSHLKQYEAIGSIIYLGSIKYEDTFGKFGYKVYYFFVNFIARGQS
jgi:hypothetical protein